MGGTVPDQPVSFREDQSSTTSGPINPDSLIIHILITCSLNKQKKCKSEYVMLDVKSEQSHYCKISRVSMNL